MTFLPGGFLGGGIGGGGGGGGGTIVLTGGEPVEQNFDAGVTVDGGTGDTPITPLSDQPVNVASVLVFQNGIECKKGVNYTISGGTNQVITWLGSSPAPLAPDDKMTYRYEKSISIPGVSSDAFRASAGRNNVAATNIWLSDADGVPHNLSPMALPFNVTLVAIVLTTNVAANWTAEVYKQPDVRAGGVPAALNAIASLASGGADKALVTGLSIAISQGDELGIFLRGTNIAYPRVDLYFERA